MEEKQLQILIVKFLENRMSAQEENVLIDYLQKKSNKKIFEEYAEIHYFTQLKGLDYERSFNRFKMKVERNRIKKRALSVMKYAAILISFVCIGYGGLYIWNNSGSKDIQNKISQSTEISSHNKAFLTLEDGSIIDLKNGEYFEEKNIISTGDELIYSNDKLNSSVVKIEYNYLTVPRGGQFFVKLEDGTKVWLNSDSKLRYPTRFEKGKSRQVELIYGEAYFEVSPSSAHKGADFIVYSEYQNIRVMGTQFNIKAYPDDQSSATTLVEGKVQIQAGARKVDLIPGEQSVVDYTVKDIQVQKVDVLPIIGWKEGVFDFKNAPLKEIMKVLSRWYDVDVVYQAPESDEVKFTGILDKEQSLEEILNILKETHAIHYTIHNHKLIIQ